MCFHKLCPSVNSKLFRYFLSLYSSQMAENDRGICFYHDFCCKLLVRRQDVQFGSVMTLLVPCPSYKDMNLRPVKCLFTAGRCCWWRVISPDGEWPGSQEHPACQPGQGKPFGEGCARSAGDVCRCHWCAPVHSYACLMPPEGGRLSHPTPMPLCRVGFGQASRWGM